MAGTSEAVLPDDGALAGLRAGNRRRVLTHLARSGPTSRAELARATGLSRTTVSAIVSDLVAEGRLVESDTTIAPHKGGSGRRPRAVGLSVPTGLVAGLDLGHAHVRVRVADRSGAVVGEQQQRLDVDAAGAVVLDLAASMVRRLVERAQAGALVGAAACVPAPVDARADRVAAEVLPRWQGRRPAEELGRLLGVPVAVDNDANLGALAEVGRGAARGARDVVYLKLSSGLGAGIVLDRRLHRGRRGRAGEIGHVRVAGPDDARPCRCGALGCLEAQVATPRLLEQVASLSPGTRVHDAATLVALDAAGDDVAGRVLRDAGRLLGGAVADLARCLDPDLVVVGGGIGRAASLRLGVDEALRAAGLDLGPGGLAVVTAHLGDEAEVAGALALALIAAGDAR